MPEYQFEKQLKRSASRWASELTHITKTNAPKHLQGGINTTSQDNGKGRIVITVKVKGKDARAQEYGSGLRAVYREKKTYPITPKTKKFLAFQWDVAEAHPEVAKFLPDGRFYIKKVNHPGIFPYRKKGYIRPSVREWRKKLKESTASEELKRALLGDVKKMFMDTKGKGK